MFDCWVLLKSHYPASIQRTKHSAKYGTNCCTLTNFTANYDAQSILEDPGVVDEIFDFIEEEALEVLKTENICVGNTSYSVSEEYIEETLKPTLNNSRMYLILCFRNTVYLKRYIIKLIRSS